MTKYNVYLNYADKEPELDGLDIDSHSEKKNIKAETLAVILKFSTQSDAADHSEVKDVLALLESKDMDVPAIILDDRLNPAHSGDMWKRRNVVRYLPLDEKNMAWNEVRRFLKDHIRTRRKAKDLQETDKLDVGWSVQIDEKDYEKYNLVSLFIGSMAHFMVELKALLDIISPETDKYKKNPVSNPDLDLPKAMEFELALRHHKTQYSYDEKSETRMEMEKYIQKNAENLFTSKPPGPTRSHIIIEGETGTGKSLIAEFIHEYAHQGINEKIKGRLRKVNCANLGDKIMETQLFGAIQGAYTDARTMPGEIMQAYNGTLFLDEIGELPPSLQARLLNYLQDQTISPVGWTKDPIYVPCLIVAATNRRLDEEVKQGRFRRDLHHRLGYTVTLPPLRDRFGDLERLIDFVLQNPQINPVRKGKTRPVQSIERDALDMLRHYDFPGNFRELEQVLRRATIMAQSSGISVITSGLLRDFGIGR
jgi:Sigma-54 interaction domain